MNIHGRKVLIGALCCVSLVGLNGCDPQAKHWSGADSPPGTPANNPPTISGAPATAGKVNEGYSFTPSASDPDGDAVSFSIENKPSWAGFDSLTGELSGIPSQIDIGNYANIIISVTDGSLTSSLPAFSVDVVDTGNFSVTISWTPPSQNTDGTSLTNLTAYKIYYGLTEGHYPNDILIDNPGITTYVVANLVPNTYYFVATAISSNGAESTYSNVVIKDAG